MQQTCSSIRYATFLLVFAVIHFTCTHTASVDNIELLPDSCSTEMDQNFIMNGDTVMFLQRSQDNYALFGYSDRRLDTIKKFNTPVFSPFLYSNEVAVLYDSSGNEKYSTTSQSFNKVLNGRKVEKVFSDHKGHYLIYKICDNHALYAYDVMKKKEHLVLEKIDQIQQAVFSTTKPVSVIAANNRLWRLNFSTWHIREIAANLEGSKINPYIAAETVLFCNNNSSEFFQIYSVGLNDSLSNGAVLFSGSHDLRLPAKVNNTLLYIEVINGEYLLKSLDLKTKKESSITTTGVVFNYSLIGNDIYYTYASAKTSKTIMRYRKRTGIADAILPSPLSAPLESAGYNIDRYKDSRTFVIKTQKDPVGIIIYIHPGQHSDFSPRFDPMLVNLALNGFIIIAPNYPMSFGYGKTYFFSPFETAVDSIINLKNEILKVYDLPIFLLSSSSGSPLMERLLIENPKGVQAAGSLFGLPGGKLASISTPTIYLLGKNDPQVDWNERSKELDDAALGNNKIVYYGYELEGHWFRKTKNFNNACRRIIQHFKEH